MPDVRNVLVERLYAAHANALKAFFVRRVRRQSEAGELAQEVYLRLLRVKDMAAIRNSEAYLFTVARNLAQEHAARDRRSGIALDVDGLDAEGQLAESPRLDADIHTDQQVRRLRTVLRQLPSKCQAAVVLQYVHGQSHEEIAGWLNVSPRMVKKYLAQALAHCRRRMGLWG